MAATPVWITAYGASRAGATAMYRSSVAGVTQIQVVGYGPPPPGGIPSGVTPVWISNAQQAGSTAMTPVAYGGPLLALPGSPANTVAPVISGTLTVGSTMSCTTGTWTGTPTITYAYQWVRNGVNIAGATSATYVTVTADGGTSLTCKVTATNSVSSASAISNVLAIAAAPSGSTWSTADATANSATLSNGNSTVVMTKASWQYIRGSASQSSGKYYVEFFTSNGSGGAEIGFGLQDATTAATVGRWLGSDPNSFGIFNVSDGNLSTPSSGANGFNFSGSTISGTPAVANDVWALAVDLTAGKAWIAKNNVWFGSGNPGSGTSPWVTVFGSAVTGKAYFPVISATSATAGSWTLQPTAASQKYAPPAGFSPWG